MGRLISTTIEKIKEDVYDLTVQDNHNFFINNILVSNCGETNLSVYGTCCLGSVNLSNMYDEEKNEVDWRKLAITIRLAIRFLDDVITMNIYPIPETKFCTEQSRRIGLGTMGLHYLLIKLGYEYGSNKCIEFVERLYTTIRNEAFEASCDLAEEKGTFIRFDSDRYIENKFIQTLPARILRKIKKHGIRNAVLLTQPPNGCLIPSTEIKLGNNTIISLEKIFLQNGIDLQKNEFKQKRWFIPTIQTNVKTINGNKRITKLYVNGKEETIEIQTVKNNKIEGTKDHKVLVKVDNNSAIWKSLNDITENDILLLKK